MLFLTQLVASTMQGGLPEIFWFGASVPDRRYAKTVIAFSSCYTWFPWLKRYMVGTVTLLFKSCASNSASVQSASAAVAKRSFVLTCRGHCGWIQTSHLTTHPLVVPRIPP